jgi:hypothetical protein
LPRIDQVIDSTAGCDLVCFLDCYSGYHQIAIKEEDQEKTAFITPFGAYYYTTMSFGLKNAGATYQRAIQACFKKQLNKNVEAYVDDVVVMTRNSNTLIADLEETFASLREYRWKLNPNKCIFNVPLGKLLGYIISHCGIEDNPEKISAITSRKLHVHQRRAEANWVHGGPEQIHLEAWRTGAPILQTTQASREVHVDSRGRTSPCSAQGLLIQATSSRLLAKSSSYCSTSLRLLTWSVLPSSSSGRKTATPIQSSDQSTSSARSCRNLRHAINQYRSYCTQC